MATRPDIAQAVGVVSQFCENPTQQHWIAVKRIFRYLQGTMDYGLYYRKTGEEDLVGYSDADWAGNLDNRRSTTGYAFLLHGACISWRSTRQRTVALSTTEAEYMALSESTQEAVWLKRLLEDLQQRDSNAPITIYGDNQGSIALTRNPEYHRRTKHIDIRHHFVREKVEDGQIVIKYCSTQDMLADLLTKPLPAEKFVKLRNKLGILSNPDSSGSIEKGTSPIG